jgi:hypothetical protein
MAEVIDGNAVAVVAPLRWIASIPKFGSATVLPIIGLPRLRVNMLVPFVIAVAQLLVYFSTLKVGGAEFEVKESQVFTWKVGLRVWKRRIDE